MTIKTGDMVYFGSMGIEHNNRGWPVLILSVDSYYGGNFTGYHGLINGKINFFKFKDLKK
jgi:hypothetical protein